MRRSDYIKAVEGAIINQPKYWAKHHNDRVAADGGTVTDKTPEGQRSHLTDYYKFLRETRLIDNLVFSWDSSSGIKERTSGVNTYATKVYDMSAGNKDAVQATEANQPFVSGNIAPNEKVSVKNNLLTSGKTITLPSEISFNAGASWAVTVVFNFDGGTPKTYELFGKASSARFAISATGFNIVNTTIVSSHNYPYDIKSIVGKNSILTVLSTGNSIQLWLNGNIIATENTIYTDIVINSFIQARDGNNNPFLGKFYYAQILNKALSASEVQAQHAYLRSQIPEIEGIAIGSQYWATSNYEGVMTSDGTVIPEVQGASTATNPELVTGGNFEGGLIGSNDDGGGGGVISTWSLNTSNPISGTQDGRLVITTAGVGGNSAYRPLLYIPMPMKQNQRYIIKFDYKVNSGTVIWSGISLGIGGNSLIPIALSGTGTTQREFTITGTPSPSLYLYFNGQNLFDLQIDNISIKEVGWADLTTPAWCYYNNDPLNGAVYGKEYNGYAVDVISANPPQGWRVATDADYAQLANYLGGLSIAGGKIKKEGFVYFNPPNTGATNESGFSAIGSGRRSGVDGSFIGLKSESAFWANRTSGDNMYRIILSSINASVVDGTLSKKWGQSIRLIRDN